jgi:hypothetical protein
VGELRLFVVQVVMVQEEQWFAPEISGPPTRSERRHYVESSLFAAPDAEAAYEMVCESLRGYSDANHDGPGDRTEYFALGLHQLEELTERLADLTEAVQGPYGLEIGLYDPADADAAGVPLVRARDQLEVFRRPRSPLRLSEPDERGAKSSGSE